MNEYDEKRFLRREKRLNPLIEKMILYVAHSDKVSFFVKHLDEQISKLNLFEYDLIVDKEGITFFITEVDYPDRILDAICRNHIGISYFWKDLEDKIKEFDRNEFEKTSEDLIEEYMKDRESRVKDYKELIESWGKEDKIL